MVGSKLKTLQWPLEDVVLKNIKSFLPGLNLTIELGGNNGEKTSGILVSQKDQKRIESVLQKNQSAQTKEVIKSAFKKPRELSSIVKKKIQSGQLSREEISVLHVNDKPMIETLADQSNTLRFINIKPGNYRLIVRETESIKL